MSKKRNAKRHTHLRQCVEVAIRKRKSIHRHRLRHPHRRRRVVVVRLVRVVQIHQVVPTRKSPIQKAIHRVPCQNHRAHTR